MLYFLGQKTLGPGRRIQLGRNAKLFGAGHAELAQSINRRSGPDAMKRGEQAFGRPELLMQH